MNTTHTPGSWKASQYMDTEQWGVITENEIIVGLSSRITKQDAHLIAAAPDMLQALQKIRGIEAWITDAKMKQLFGETIYPAIQKATILNPGENETT